MLINRVHTACWQLTDIEIYIKYVSNIENTACKSPLIYKLRDSCFTQSISRLGYIYIDEWNRS